MVLIGIHSSDDVQSNSGYDFINDDIVYKIISEDDLTVSVNSYTGIGGDLIIPETTAFEGKTYLVTSIGNSAFGHREITSVFIPWSVTTIAGNAFYESVGLKYIHVDKTNPTFSSYDGVLFNKDMTQLLKCPENRAGSFKVPDGVVSIGRSAIEGKCDAFMNCTKLTEVRLPGSVREIYTDAFEGSGIRSINIPAGVEVIQTFAFRLCKSLERIDVDEGNLFFSSKDGVLFNKDESLLIQYPCNKGGAYSTMPDTVQTISINAFEGAERLTRIVLPDTLSVIENFAFHGCTSLERLNIPRDLVKLGANALEETKIETFHISADLTTIGVYAFRGCTELTEITVDPNNPEYESVNGALLSENGGILLHYPAKRPGSFVMPDTVENIEFYAFQNCTGLTDVTISERVSKINSYAFLNCTNLKRMFIPSSVTSISDCVFDGCVNLEEIEVHGENTEYYSIDGILYDANLRSLIRCPEGYKGEVNISLITESVAHEAFYKCRYIESIVFPGLISSVGEYAFKDCTSLQSVYFDDWTQIVKKSIGAYAFDGCVNLSQLELSWETESIGDYAFRNCSSLTSVYFHVSVEYVGIGVFDGCSNLESIGVNIYNPYYSELDGVLFDTTRTHLIRYPEGREGPYVVPSEIRSFDRTSFNNCSKLTSITLHSNLKINEAVLFEGCTSLKEILFQDPHPDYVSQDGVLYDKDMTRLIRCPADKSGTLVLPDTVSVINRGAFEDCSELTGIVIHGGDSLYIDYEAFIRCSPDISIASGRDGYDVKLYSDPDFRNELTSEQLSDGWYGVTYLKWTDTTLMGTVLKISAVVAVISLLCAISIWYVRR